MSGTEKCTRPDGSFAMTGLPPVKVSETHLQKESGAETENGHGPAVRGDFVNRTHRGWGLKSSPISCPSESTKATDRRVALAYSDNASCQAVAASSRLRISMESSSIGSLVKACAGAPIWLAQEQSCLIHPFRKISLIFTSSAAAVYGF